MKKNINKIIFSKELDKMTRHSETLMLVNEIDNLIEKEISDKYKFIIIKELIQRWRDRK
jgi:hypothetical protein